MLLVGVFLHIPRAAAFRAFLHSQYKPACPLKKIYLPRSSAGDARAFFLLFHDEYDVIQKIVGKSTENNFIKVTNE